MRRPRSCAAPGSAYKGMSFRVCMAPKLCGPAAARPRRFRCVGTAAVRLRVPSQFPVLLLLSVLRVCSSATVPPPGAKSITPIAFSGPQARKTRPLQHFTAPRPEKCDPYNTLGPPGLKHATPTALWAPQARKMRPLHHFGDPRPEKCDPCSTLRPPGQKNVTPTTFWGHQVRKMCVQGYAI